MNANDADRIKEAVRDRYAGHAKAKTSCCSTSCCTPERPTSDAVLPRLYDKSDLAEIPADADLALGCGNPLALESLKPGETVVDLGSGGGIDCFLAAKRVGDQGHVIGVDMTPEMVALARRNAERAGYANVEFRLGEIEDLPVEDDTADLIISNCVINLVPDKPTAFREAFRITKPGGRISVSDIVTTEPLPQFARDSLAAYVACLAGASTIEDYLGAARAAGFEDVHIASESAYAMDDEEADALLASLGGMVPAGVPHGEAQRVAKLFRSVTVQARKPA